MIRLISKVLVRLSGAPTAPSLIAIKMDVPWEEANRHHRLRLALFDEYRQPVRVADPNGPLEIGSDFEVGRPQGGATGPPTSLTLMFNLEPLPLQADRLYVWRCYIDGRTEEGWQLRFSTRSNLGTV